MSEPKIGTCVYVAIVERVAQVGPDRFDNQRLVLPLTGLESVADVMAWVRSSNGGGTVELIETVKWEGK